MCLCCGERLLALGFGLLVLLLLGFSLALTGFILLGFEGGLLLCLCCGEGLLALGFGLLCLLLGCRGLALSGFFLLGEEGCLLAGAGLLCIGLLGRLFTLAGFL